MHLLDPSVRLHLRIDHERPTARVRRDDAVVDREGVVGQPVDVPRADLDLLRLRVRVWVRVRVRLRS